MSEDPSATPAAAVRIPARWLWGIIGLSLAIHIGFLAAGQVWFPSWRWENHPAHGALEMAGALVAWFVAWFLTGLEREGRGSTFNTWIAGALVGMGTLDAVHALTHAGDSFVWLHSAATLLGGALFALVWLPPAWAPRRWPLVVFGAALVLGAASLALPGLVPVMVDGGEFTAAAKAMNIAGGVGLFAATVKLVRTWRVTGKSDDLLFALHCALFGAAALMFEQSTLWDLPWWGWHLLRLLAYAVALVLVGEAWFRGREELVRLDNELRYSGAIYRSLGDALPLAVFFKNLKGEFVYVNRLFCERVGRKEEEIIGRTDFDLFPEQEARKYRDDDARVLETGKLFHTVENNPDPEGGVRYVEVLKNVVLRDGQPAGVHGVFWDVTRRVRAEDEAEESRLLLQTLVVNTPVAVAMMDTEMRYLAWSRRWLTDYRLGDRDLKGLSHYDVFPEIGEDWKAVHRRCLAGATESRDEDPFVRADGTLDYVRWIVRPWHRAGGEVGGLIMFTEVITDRVEAARALRESEDRFQAFMNQSPVVAWIKDDHYRFQYVNAPFEALFATTADKILGLTDDDLLPPEVAAQTRANDLKVLETGEVLETIERVPGADGKIRPWLVEKFPLQRPEGGVWVGGTAMDLTARMEAEAAGRLNAFGLERASVAFYLVGPEGRILRVNRASCEMLGYTSEELTGLTVHDIDPDFPPSVWPEHWKAMREEQHRGFESTHRRKDGTTFPIEIDVDYLEFEGREYNFAFVRDISGRKRARDALRASEEQFRLVARATQDAIWDVDLVGQTVWWNETYDRLFGPRPPEANKPWEWWQERVAEGERDAVVQSLKAVLADPAVDHWEAEYHFGNPGGGGERFIQDRAHISRDEDGAAIRIVGSMRDQTALEEAMAERERMERKIQEAQRLESLGVLAGGIAHDFNNLLTAMLGNVSLIQSELPPASDYRPMLDDVENAALRAADLCKQMLAYAGKGRFVLRPIDLSQLVREMVQLIKISISKSAHLQFHLAEDLPPVMADAAQLNQVVMNLVINASEAIGDRQGNITLATGVVEADAAYLAESGGAPDLAPGPYVYLETGDTGSGMDPATLGKIFDPFFSTKFTGRGLGLAAVQGIVRGHGGALRVYSEPGSGTTFKILLPAAGAGAEVSGPEAADPAPAAGRNKGTVLVVDDEESVRETAERILRRNGFEVVLAPDGEEGLRAFKASLPDLVAVLLDLTMPQVDGVEAFRRMRLISADVPVVLMSGYNEQAAVQRFTGKGLAGFLQKPFLAPGLLKKIAAAVDPGEGGEGDPPDGPPPS